MKQVFQRVERAVQLVEDLEQNMRKRERRDSNGDPHAATVTAVVGVSHPARMRRWGFGSTGLFDGPWKAIRQ